MRYKIPLFLIVAWAIARFCHYQTDGLRLSKIEGNTTPIVKQLPPLLSDQEKEELHRLFSQPFTYFGRGKQSFAFVSADGSYVLKFFNNRLHQRLFWFPDQQKKKKLHSLFESVQIAWNHLKEETGLLYFHPQAGPDPMPSVTLIDKLGIAHTVDLNLHAFVIQKRAELVYPYLEALPSDEARKEALSSLVSLLRKKIKMGIHDNDPLIRANMGFIEGKAIQIDIGPLSYDRKLDEKKEIERMTLSLKHWLEAHRPALAPYLDEKIHSQ